jgi:hypothetical protein
MFSILLFYVLLSLIIRGLVLSMIEKLRESHAQLRVYRKCLKL